MTRWQQIARESVGPDYAAKYAERFRALAARGDDVHGEATFVTGLVRRPGPGRYRRLTAPAGRYRLDLSTGTPDVALLPDLGPALARLDRTTLTTSYLDRPVLPEGRLTEMVRVSHALAELANIAPNTHQAYVGQSAFSHKAGLHASAIKVDPELYNHLDPSQVGNDMHILITEMAGRASVELKAAELGVDLMNRPGVVAKVVDTV